MKTGIPKVSWATKALSNMFYIREVSLDGKNTNPFSRRLGHYGLYAAQVMRVGNCLTLLSSIPTFSLDNFRNTNLLVDMVRFVYWTFNVEFQARLDEHLCSFSIAELTNIKSLLARYPSPYIGIEDDGSDEELAWCKVKNERLRKDDEFSLLFEKDSQNRAACKKHVKVLLERKNKTNLNLGGENVFPVDISFSEMLLSDKKTLVLSEMEQAIIEVGFPRNPFHPVSKNRKGANQYGLNAQMAAIVYHFQQLGYFKPGFTFKEIYRAFGKVGSNGSGKDYNLDYFQQDYLFNKYLNLFSSGHQ